VSAPIESSRSTRFLWRATTSFACPTRSLRPLLLIPAALMVAAVATMFMQIGRGPVLVRVFAAAGLLWLSILLGLGSVDPLTRTDHTLSTHVR
jgi:hypothetical protein